MDQTTERLILQRLDEISAQLRALNEDIHASDRRMDAFERSVDTLAVTDTKQASQIATLESKVAELEPVREVVGNLKRLFYAGAALAALLAAMPWLQKFIGK